MNAGKPPLASNRATHSNIVKSMIPSWMSGSGLIASTSNPGRHRHAGSLAASRSRPQVRPAQLAHQNRQYRRCTM